MARCGTRVIFFLLPGLFTRINFNSPDVCGDHMGVDISENLFVCLIVYYTQ